MDRTWVSSGLKVSELKEDDIPSLLVQRVSRLRARKSFIQGLLKQVFNSHRFEQYVKSVQTETAVPHISAQQIKEFPILLPPLPEQKKIARILSTWDKAIETVDKLIENSQQQKKALMQQLLTGKKRLPGFNGEWKEVRLREIFQPVTRKNTKNIGLVLTVSGENGLVDQTTYFNRKVAADCLDGYYHLKKGEFAYNRSSMKGYPFGSIKRLEKHENGVVSTLYMCFKLKNTVNSADFYSHYFEYGLANKELYKVTQVGARAHGLLNISKGDFFDIKILCPPEDEQQSIANALDTMDAVLLNNKHQKKLLLFQKMALMQQLLTGKRRVTIDDMDNANG
jgi:type I restriction enzyme S subunit